MSYFEFPHTRDYDGDLGYIIKKLTEIVNEFNTFSAVNKIKYAGFWSIDNYYEPWTVVVYNDFAYICTKAVPAGVAIDNADFWIPTGTSTVDDVARTAINEINSALAVITTDIIDLGEDVAEIKETTENFNNRLTTEKNERKAEDVVINDRIDNLIALTPGSTTGDAELQDIRVGANGITYPTAGSAVRGQYTELNNKIINNSQSIYNVENAYISGSGVVTPSASYICTSFIPLSMVKNIHCKPASGYSVNIHFFDKDFEQTRRQAITDETFYPLKPDSGEVYVRIWTYSASISDFMSAFDIECISTTPGFQFPPVWTNGFYSNAGNYTRTLLYTCTSLIPVNMIKGFSVASDKTVNVNYFDDTFTGIGTAQFTEGYYDISDMPADSAYIAFWFSGNDITAFASTIKIIYGALNREKIVVFGDSWSDDDPDHTSYTKWTALLKENPKYNVKVYAQNGSYITGDTPNYGQNGNVAGQIEQFNTDGVANVDTFIIFGGINDFRGDVSSDDLSSKLSSIVSSLRSSFPKARFIYLANHQIFITKEQLDYFHKVVNYCRHTIGIEAFVTFGWINASHYISDMVHPDNAGYKSLFANIMSILNGGSPYYVTNTLAKTVGSTYSFAISERWVDGIPVYYTRGTLYTGGLNNTYTFTTTNTDHYLCASIPFVTLINKVQASSANAEPCRLDNTTAETFNTTYKMNDTSSFTLKTASANSGAYRSDNCL